MCIYETRHGICRKFTDEKAVMHCVYGTCPNERLSNADRIRSMTDEELAVIIAAEFTSEQIPFCKSKPECEKLLDEDKDIPEEMCVECVVEWLRQPAKEETL